MSSTQLGVAPPELSETGQPTARPDELLLPNCRLPHAESFSATVDIFMDSDEHQLVEYRGRWGHTARIDRYTKYGEMVYSIIHAIHPADGLFAPNTHQATSLIRGEDGQFYGERHIFKEDMIDGEEDGLVIVSHRGIDHPLRSREWKNQIIPISRALQSGHRLLKVIS